MSFIADLFHKLGAIFTSDRAKKAFHDVGALVTSPTVLAVVKKIAELTPNRTDDEIAGAFEHFQVEYKASGDLDPWHQLLDLAVQQVAKVVPPSTATNLIVAAVSLLVTGSKNDK